MEPAPVVLFFAGVMMIVVIGMVAGGFFGLVVGVPVAIFNQVFAFEKNLARFRHKSNSLAGRIARAVYWLRNEPLPDGGPDDSKGARFATRAEMIAAHNAAPSAMAFGHYEQDRTPFCVHTDKHVLIMASTRSGKGVSLIIPHLLRYTGSAFVLDPKGENAKATGRQRARYGAVHYLDPFGVSGKPQSRFNPLSRFTDENMEAESKALAAAMFLVADKERDHWNMAGQQLLAALILYVYCSPRFDRSSMDLIAVRHVLLTELLEPGVNGREGRRPVLEDMRDLDAGDGLLSDLANSFLATPEKEFGSIVSTAQRQTEILDNPYLQACLAASGSGDEVDFASWHGGTMTVYLCLSAPKFPTFSRWLRLVLTSALDEMTDRLDPPPLPVSFMLDELATLGHLEAVENAVGLSAGYGIQLITVFQDVAQMRDLYKGRWASFIGNAGVRAIFNLDDFDTAEYWSKFIGGRLVETRSTTEDIYGFNKGDNVSEAMRPLIAPEKLMIDFASAKMLVLVQGEHPMVTRRTPYYEDKSLAGSWDDPRKKVVAAAPPSAPQPPARPSPPSNGSGPRPTPPTTPPRPAPAAGPKTLTVVKPEVAPARPTPAPSQNWTTGIASFGQVITPTPRPAAPVAKPTPVARPVAKPPATAKTSTPQAPPRPVPAQASKADTLEEEMAKLLARDE